MSEMHKYLVEQGTVRSWEELEAHLNRIDDELEQMRREINMARAAIEYDTGEASKRVERIGNRMKVIR